MGNKHKAIGTRFENLVLEGLRHVFPAAQRTPQLGKDDIGDILNIGSWVVECKAVKAWDASGWLKEAKKEAANARLPYYACVIKKRGTTDPLEMYVLTDLRTLLGVME